MTKSNIQYVSLQNPLLTSNGYYINKINYSEDASPYRINRFGPNSSGISSGQYLTESVISWGLYNPELNYVAYDQDDISKFRTFSGFDIKLYEVTGAVDYLDSSIKYDDKVLITGITGSQNFLNFQIYTDDDYYPDQTIRINSHDQSGFLNYTGSNRNFEAEIVSVDRFNNRNTGIAILNNDPPVVDIRPFQNQLSTGISDGQFFIDFN